MTHRLDFPRQSLAAWLDAPLRTMRIHGRAFAPVLGATVAALLVTAGIGSLVAPSAPSGETASWTMLTGSPLSVLHASLLSPLVTLGVQTFWFAALLRFETTGACGLADVWADCQRKAVWTASLAWFAFQGAMVFFVLSTCGLGIVVWAVAQMLVPLTLPIALREDVPGVAAVVRSTHWMLWRAPGDPWHGSMFPVVVALHVIAGLSSVVMAVPQIPTVVWAVHLGAEVLGRGRLDPWSLVSLLQPPLWVSIPSAVGGVLASVVATAYGAHLMLDLHTAIVRDAEGADLRQLLEKIEHHD